MKTENKVLMMQARESLKGKWGIAVGVAVVYLFLTTAGSSMRGFGSFFAFIIAGPMMLGLNTFTLALSRGKEIKFVQIFEGFNDFGRAVIAYLWMVLFVILWALLLIIPGIIAAISYSQIFYIMADDKDITPKEAMKKSKKMMYGYKWKYFCLGWRFIGWILLSILTVGIGFLWVFPYIQVSMAKFHDDISKENKANV